MHDAAEDLLEGDRCCDFAARVDALQRAARETLHAFAEPPGHAVHRRQHNGAWAEQRADAARDLRERRAFDGDDDKVLQAELGRTRRRAHRALQATLGRIHAPPVRAQCLERCAARQRADLRMPRGHQTRADEAADRAGADDANLHAAITPCRPRRRPAA